MTEENDQSSTTETASKKSRGTGCLIAISVLVGLGLLSTIVIVYVLPWAAGKGIVAAREKVIDAFSPDTITQTFVSWSELQAQGTEGNILEVATATGTEKFERKSSLKLWNRTLPLGTTVSEISVPATYRYHIDLNSSWQLTTDGNQTRVIAIAPRIRPSLPVAFDTGAMQKKSKAGWGRWDAAENMAELEKTLTTELNLRASLPKTIAAVREESRIAVAKFIQRWLLTQEQWGEDTGFTEITVIFEDEIEQPDGSILDITAQSPVIHKSKVLP